MSHVDWDLLSRAIVVYSGKGRFKSPRFDRADFVEAFGAVDAERLLPVVRAMVDEFYLSNAASSAGPFDDLQRFAKMGRLAKAEFKAKHPEISEAALDALSWSYTFDHR
jgi:hypothetical protein